MPAFNIVTSNNVTVSDPVIWSVTGDAILNDNSLVEYVVDPVNNAVTVNCKVEDGYKSKLYKTEYDCVIAHSNTVVSPIGSPVSIDFTHYDNVIVSNAGSVTTQHVPIDNLTDPNGYYIAAINEIESIKGAFGIIGGKRLHWAPTDNGITITDISKPGVDCTDYMRLTGYISKLEEVLSELANQAAQKPGMVDGEKIYGIFAQYRAMRELWNYLVICNMIVFNTLYQGDTAYVQSKLANTSAYDIPIGDITISFPADGVPAGSGENDLDAIFTGYTYKKWLYGNTTTSTGWELISGERQRMTGGEWVLEAPNDEVVRPGETVEIQARFKISATIDPSDPLSVDVHHQDTPWAGQWPVAQSGYITHPGHLSFFNTHFNPTSYSSPVPDGLPPTGDGCTMRMSPGTATAAWNAQGLARCVVRPEIYISLSCTADSMTSSFLTNFSHGVECNDLSEGTYSLSLTATTCTLMLTPTGGTAFPVLTITMTNRHFHEGDGIALALPKGWSDELRQALQGGLNVPTQVSWELPAGSLITSDSEAGGTKSLSIPEEAAPLGSMLKRIKLDSQMYKIDSVRGMVAYGETEV